jgi:hypothetical protein
MSSVSLRSSCGTGSVTSSRGALFKVVAALLVATILCIAVVGCGNTGSSSRSNGRVLPQQTARTRPVPADAALGLRSQGYDVTRVPRSSLPEAVKAGLAGVLKVRTQVGTLSLYGYRTQRAARVSTRRVAGHVYSRLGVWIVTAPPGLSRAQLNSLDLASALNPRRPS